MSQLSKLNPHFKPSFDGKIAAIELVQKLIAHKTILKAILFGSSALNKNTADSDLDILVVIPEDQDPKDYYKVVNQAHYSTIAVDWIFKKESEFLNRKDIGGICFIADQTGIVISNGG